MKKVMLICLLALIVIGCEQHDKNANSASKNQDQGGEMASQNVPDKNGAMFTPIDQSDDDTDRMITKNIRQYLMADDGLSPEAKNIKIITINRIVTLRGPVVNAHEKEIIERKASHVKGVEKIDNFIEVKRSK